MIDLKSVQIVQTTFQLLLMLQPAIAGFWYKQVPPILCTILDFQQILAHFLFMMASTLYLGLYCFVPHFWYRGCGGFGSPPLQLDLWLRH